MGRCNNRRAQQRAQELRNTPARARFSGAPPSRRKKAGRGRGRGEERGRGPESDTRKQTQARVVQKIEQRVQAQQSGPSKSRRSPLDGIDLSKLDEIKLPEDTIEEITNLLKDLGVIEDPQQGSSNAETQTQVSAVQFAEDGDVADDTFEISSEMGVSSLEENFAATHPSQEFAGTSSGYSEYEDDGDEYAGNGHFVPEHHTSDEDVEWEGPVEADDGEDDQGDSVDVEMLRDPIFIHLTQQLSFSESTATRACKAVETWSVVDVDESQTKTRPSKLNLVMDWLCLHLTAEELEAGFRKKPGIVQPKMPPTVTAIPHPSISVAKKLTEDVEWTRMMRWEERVVRFLRLGFHHGEVMTALQKTDPEAEKTSVPALEDIDALCILLASLEREVLNGDEPVDKTGEAVCEDELEFERQQEREALCAIYEDHFQQLELSGEGMLGRYKISIMLAEKLEPTSMTNICDLHVFLRSGYPSHQSPLFLFECPSLPWPFLRRVDSEIVRQAQESLPDPSIFQVVTWLSDSLPEMLKEYNREQRSKEFKETQVRLRKEVGHLVDEEMLDFESSNGKLSRRRRTRLKAAERAFDRDAKEKKLEEERRKLQTERLDRIKHENSNMRQLMADKAILRREMEQHEQEIRKVSRAAMNAAFNGGESTEDARKAARDAELKYRREHGLEPAMDRDTMTCVAAKRGDRDPDGELEKQKESDDTRPKVSATQSTILFMDRLREMYSNAVSQKGACSLAEPRGQYSSLEDPGQDEEKKLPRPIAVPVGDLARIMEDEVVAVQKDRPWLVAPEARFLPVIDETDVVEGGQQPDQRKEILNRKLLADLEWSLQNPSKKVQKIREETQKLPAFEKREQIVSTICANQVTLISASTGAGKTTIVPGLLLNHMIRKGQGAEANIIVTQPRRISAIGVAERIASERGEKVGETCGYSIKLERKCSKKTKITLCTTGILLRRLQCDPDLATVSHVIVDEVHERDLNTDFALIILKELLKRRPSLKLVLMSATLDKDIFATYFEACATVSITGRAFPVREYRLEDILELTGFEVQEGSDYAFKENNESKEARLSKTALKKLYYPKYSSKTIHSLSIADESVINYELVAELVQHICCRMVNGEEGAILIFMPGMVEISSTIDELYKKEYFQSESVIIYPLHSSLSTNEQTRVFEVPPSGTRKIVVATNIAETSITIPDVLYVVDCGRVKENRRDEVKEAPALVECWVSRASAQQRRGRAGRVQPGFAYHLFSSHTYDTELQDYQLPEMLRVGLEDLALQILILDLGEPSAFLGNALSPPTALAMKNSLRLLKELGAIECEICESDEESGTCADLAGTSTELTALGFHLATLPVEPRIGKLVLYGALFNCLDPALTIAASMSSKSPFVSPFDNRDAANEARQGFSVDDSSDHLTVLTAFDRWKDIRSSKGDRKAKEFARESFLSLPTLFQMEELRKQFSSLLKDIGFLTKGLQLGGKNRGGPKQQSGTTNDRDMSLVKGVLLAGLYPNVIVAPRSLVDGSSEQQAGEMAFQSRSRGNVYLHPCTLSFSAKRLGSRYCCFREIVQTKKLYVRDATAVSPVALLLFGGALHVYHDKSVISVDEWLKFRVERKSATLVKHLRGQMENMLLRKIVSPQEDVTSTPEAKALISSVSTLLQLGSEEIILDSASQKQSGSREGSRLEDNRGDPRRRNGGRGRVGGRMSARARGPPCADQSRQLPH